MSSRYQDRLISIIRNNLCVALFYLYSKNLEEIEMKFKVKRFLGNMHHINEDGVCGMHNWA